MKKGIKIFLIIFAIIVIIVLADTIQAKVFDNNPLIKIRYNRDGGNVDYVDKGIFVYTYVFTNGEKVTVFRWEKYAPPEELVDFEILFKDRQPIDSYNKIYAILDKSETNKYNYTIYAYDGSVNIRINGEEYSLKEALLEDKITMEEIIAKANKDFPNTISYDDGGSIEYHYDNYTIIKYHTIDGNRDVYIGTRDMTINDLGNLY